MRIDPWDDMDACGDIMDRMSDGIRGELHHATTHKDSSGDRDHCILESQGDIQTMAMKFSYPFPVPYSSQVQILLSQVIAKAN